MEPIIRGGIDMENGSYTRRELQIVLYEKEGAEPFVVVKNDRYANHPVVLFGESAESLIQSIVTYLDRNEEVKGS